MLSSDSSLISLFPSLKIAIKECFMLSIEMLYNKVPCVPSPTPNPPVEPSLCHASPPGLQALTRQGHRSVVSGPAGPGAQARLNLQQHGVYQRSLCSEAGFEVYDCAPYGEQGWEERTLANLVLTEQIPWPLF